jgi:hypothetical protein
MGKQTKRQKAKAKEPVVDAPMPETTLCCLPHCEEPGKKLECNHLLCGMDFLKLTRYVSQVEEFRLTCPLCRRVCNVDPRTLMDLIDNHLEFKCAVFKCGCVKPGCSRSFSGTIRPCKSHKSYTCKVCKGDDRSRLKLSNLAEDSDDEPDQPRRGPNFIYLRGWGMTDAQFEQVMVIYKRSVGGMSAAVERIYRMIREVGYGLHEDWAIDLEEFSRGGDVTQTKLFKFLNAYCQIVHNRP